MNLKTIFIFSIYTIIHIYCDQDYFQILDEFSFDIRNPLDKENFYKNFIREGSVYMDKNNLIMNEKTIDSHGLIYSLKVKNKWLNNNNNKIKC